LAITSLSLQFTLIPFFKNLLRLGQPRSDLSGTFQPCNLLLQLDLEVPDPEHAILADLPPAFLCWKRASCLTPQKVDERLRYNA
jgi:hypothetical protein